MSLSGAMSSALSALAAGANSLGATAHNVANLTTAGFQPIEVQFSSVGGSHDAGGGVQAIFRPRLALSAESLDLFNVDVGGEFSRLIQARAAYRSGAALVLIAEAMARATTEITA